MDFKDFKECIDNLSDIHLKNTEAYKLGLDVLNYHDPYHRAINILWKEILTEEGFDWLEWYLYEKNGISDKPKEDLKAWECEKEICKNLEDLHGYLTKNRYFRRNGK